MFGFGEETQFLPLHLLLYKIRVPKCKVIYRALILTGSDSTSKISSKKSAINANPELYLQQFGEENKLSVKAAEHAEQYLIKLEQPKSTCVTFNELRFNMYQSRKTTYIKLPPSSHSLQGHLQHCFFIIRMAMNLLDNQFEIDPLELVGQRLMAIFCSTSSYCLSPISTWYAVVARRSAQGTVHVPNRMLHVQTFANAKGSVPTWVDTLFCLFFTLFRSLVIYAKFN